MEASLRSCGKCAECYAGLRSSGCDLIINVHCSGESASKIGEFINNLKFLSIHSDGDFAQISGNEMESDLILS